MFSDLSVLEYVFLGFLRFMISVVRMSVLGRVFLGCDILQCRSHPCTNDNGAVDDEDDGEGVVEERC
jgi:hypothetical protein